MVDNPQTPQDDQKRKERKKRLVRKKKQFIDESSKYSFDIPGVQKVVIGQDAQEKVGCIVGEHVTSENPWNYVKKEDVQYYNDLYEEASDFWKIRQEVNDFPNADILVGYIPDIVSTCDEFYICLTVAAEKTVNDIIDKINTGRQENLQKLIVKTVSEWKGLGSDEEIDKSLLLNSRPLIMIDLESKYPILTKKPHFSKRTVQDSKTGYVEVPSEEVDPDNVVYRSRIDTSVQKGFQKVNQSILTNFIPKYNAATLHDYLPELEEKITERFLTRVYEATSSAYHKIGDQIYVNSSLDFYANDYKNLVKVESDTVDKLRFTEYMEFRNTTTCMGKQISTACWHPLWTGIVAIAYSDISLFSFYKSASKVDEVQKTVFDSHPVLLWSLNDVLEAKLFLESPRDIKCLSFCPYDENVLIGGMKNGQVIVWDLKNKLSKVEEEEILTASQHSYRKLMHSKISWMKNIKDLSRVPFAAISASESSHSDVVTAIKWIPPHWPIGKNGHFGISEDESKLPNLQFLTTSLDGTVAFWDLLGKQMFTAGATRGKRRLKRLKKRPSALTMDVSPYRILHKVLKPEFLLKNCLQTEDRLIPISSCMFREPDITYQQKYPDFKSAHFTQRVIFEPNIIKSSKTKSEIVLGTTEGHVIVAKWDGYDYSSSSLIMSENCIYIAANRFHDGPVIVFQNHAIPQIYLTIGGTIFAIWNETFKDYPIIWRRSKHRYTFGLWYFRRPAMFRLTRSDGNIEIWQLLSKSNGPADVQPVTGKSITLTLTHTLPMQKNLHGTADENGSLRLFFSQRFTAERIQMEKDRLEAWNEREVKRKLRFHSWQKKWQLAHIAELEEQKKIKIELHKKEEDEKLRKKMFMEEEKKRKEAEEAKRKLMESQPQPGFYKEWAEKQWRNRELDCMNNTLLAKKGLNTELLEKQQKPLTELAKTTEHRMHKKKRMEENSTRIFSEAISTIFPELLEERPILPPDPYVFTQDYEDTTLQHTQKYHTVTSDCSTFLSTHHLHLDFDWTDVKKSGIERRKIMDGFFYGPNHKQRIQRERIEKKPLLHKVFDTAKPIRRSTIKESSSDLVGETDQENQENQENNSAS